MPLPVVLLQATSSPSRIPSSCRVGSSGSGLTQAGYHRSSTAVYYTAPRYSSRSPLWTRLCRRMGMKEARLPASWKGPQPQPPPPPPRGYRSGIRMAPWTMAWTAPWPRKALARPALSEGWWPATALVESCPLVPTGGHCGLAQSGRATTRPPQRLVPRPPHHPHTHTLHSTQSTPGTPALEPAGASATLHTARCFSNTYSVCTVHFTELCAFDWRRQARCWLGDLHPLSHAIAVSSTAAMPSQCNGLLLVLLCGGAIGSQEVLLSGHRSAGSQGAN